MQQRIRRETERGTDSPDGVKPRIEINKNMHVVAACEIQGMYKLLGSSTSELFIFYIFCICCLFIFVNVKLLAKGPLLPEAASC